MTLTKEDLGVIRTLIREEVGTLIKEELTTLIRNELRILIREETKTLIREELTTLIREEVRKVIIEEIDPLRRAFKQLAQAQVGIVDQMELTEGNVKLIMRHLNLSPEIREMRKTLPQIE